MCREEQPPVKYGLIRAQHLPMHESLCWKGLQKAEHRVPAAGAAFPGGSGRQLHA